MGNKEHSLPILDDLFKSDHGKIGWIAKWPEMSHCTLSSSEWVIPLLVSGGVYVHRRSVTPDQGYWDRI
jgi:hypothetical protein